MFDYNQVFTESTVKFLARTACCAATGEVTVMVKRGQELAWKGNLEHLGVGLTLANIAHVNHTGSLS